MSEIEVYGTKRVPDSALPVEPERSVENALSDRYLVPEDFGGIENILCTPICRGDGSSYDEGGMITAEEFARYVGYYENGAIQDTFFDTFLFSPCADFAPAAERITLKGWRFSLTFWTFSIANIFTNLFIDVNQSGFATLDARFW